MQNLKLFKKKFLVLSFNFTFCIFILSFAFAQDSDLELSLDVNSNTIPLPNIFKPNMDLSGRGFQSAQTWPQSLADQEVIDTWGKDIGFGAMHRLQFDLWEISQAAKEKEQQKELLANYESVMKQISDAGGIVVLNLFGTPAGLGRVLDKISVPVNTKAFKELVKGYIRELSCVKRYNIWYEVWSAPDIDDFLLGRKQDYLALYKIIAETIKELEGETKVYIPVGGPGTSWWFQNVDGNTIADPERSLIYELIKFCAHYNLPLNFISWHAYSTDPKSEKELTVYGKNSTALIREWLSYFHFATDTPLVVTEWNYDNAANILSGRNKDSFVAASYIPSRIKNMYEAKLDSQVYFALEDFQNQKEGIARNVGAFWFDSRAYGYNGGPKPIYSVFRVMSKLGGRMYVNTNKFSDEFVGVIATRNQEGPILMIYNYIDPNIAENFLSRSISSLNEKERRALLKMVKNDKLKKLLDNEIEINSLRATNRLKAMLKKAQELRVHAARFKDAPRNVKIEWKNLNSIKPKVVPDDNDTHETKETYVYERYSMDSACGTNCDIIAVEEKEITPESDSYRDTLTLRPYSVNVVMLKKVLKKIPPPEPQETPQEQTAQDSVPETIVPAEKAGEVPERPATDDANEQE